MAASFARTRRAEVGGPIGPRRAPPAHMIGASSVSVNAPLLGRNHASDAAQKAADRLGVAVRAVVIGPGREVTDLYFDWSRLSGVDEDGAVLVRPDKHIAWRAGSLPVDPEAELMSVLTTVLSREESA